MWRLFILSLLVLLVSCSAQQNVSPMSSSFKSVSLEFDKNTPSNYDIEASCLKSYNRFDKQIDALYSEISDVKKNLRESEDELGLIQDKISEKRKVLDLSEENKSPLLNNLFKLEKKKRGLKDDVEEFEDELNELRNRQERVRSNYYASKC